MKRRKSERKLDSENLSEWEEESLFVDDTDAWEVSDASDEDGGGGGGTEGGGGINDGDGLCAEIVNGMYKDVFLGGFGISHRILELCGKRTKLGVISRNGYDNMGYMNAETVDVSTMPPWFRHIADEVGEPGPVRVQMLMESSSRVKRFCSYNEYTTLPASLTWNALWDEFIQWVDECGLLMVTPSITSFCEILK